MASLKALQHRLYKGSIVDFPQAAVVFICAQDCRLSTCSTCVYEELVRQPRLGPETLQTTHANNDTLQPKKQGQKLQPSVVQFRA